MPNTKVFPLDHALGGGNQRVRYKHTDGQYYDAVIEGGTLPGGPFNIYVPALKPAGTATARKTGILLATAKAQTNRVHLLHRVS